MPEKNDVGAKRLMMYRLTPKWCRLFHNQWCDVCPIKTCLPRDPWGGNPLFGGHEARSIGGVYLLRADQGPLRRRRRRNGRRRLNKKEQANLLRYIGIVICGDGCNIRWSFQRREIANVCRDHRCCFSYQDKRQVLRPNDRFSLRNQHAFQDLYTVAFEIPTYSSRFLYWNGCTADRLCLRTRLQKSQLWEMRDSKWLIVSIFMTRVEFSHLS